MLSVRLRVSERVRLLVGYLYGTTEGARDKVSLLLVYYCLLCLLALAQVGKTMKRRSSLR